MRNKKMLSTVVAGALVATTMAMPVMAADGGNLPVTVTTKNAVIRVEVPTKMEISVNQFEMGDGGSQIYSSAFDMKNKSEIPVKVSVTSTADLKNTTKLLGTKAAAGTSTAAGEAWMAVAAQTAANSYADGTASTIGDLTESNNNVATFVQGTDANAAKGTVSQVFYLNKSNTMAYKLLNAGESASKIEYAQFYELTAETVADQDALDALLAEKDVYVGAAAAANGQALTKVAKGGSHTYAGANATPAGTEEYYTAAITGTAKASIDSSKLYVYGDGSVDTAGAAAFRYIGKLSGAQETWTKDDVSTVTIKYDIVGVQESKYTTEAANCTYGLYKTPAAAPSIATTSYTMVSDTDINVNVNLGAGSLAATDIDSVKWGNVDLLEKGYAEYEDGVITIKAAAVNNLLGRADSSYTLDIAFNDSASTVKTVTLNK